MNVIVEKEWVGLIHRSKPMNTQKFECIDYEKDVSKIEELKSKQERFCYLFRYNAQVLTAMGKYELARAQNDGFMNTKSKLKESRFYEIMNLADNNFYEKYNL